MSSMGREKGPSFVSPAYIFHSSRVLTWLVFLTQSSLCSSYPLFLKQEIEPCKQRLVFRIPLVFIRYQKDLKNGWLLLLLLWNSFLGVINRAAITWQSKIGRTFAEFNKIDNTACRDPLCSEQFQLLLFWMREMVSFILREWKKE